jgi:hypothetical protein
VSWEGSGSTDVSGNDIEGVRVDMPTIFLEEVRVGLNGNDLGEVRVDMPAIILGTEDEVSHMEAAVRRASIQSKEDAELELINLISSPLDISKNRESIGSNRLHWRRGSDGSKDSYTDEGIVSWAAATLGLKISFEVLSSLSRLQEAPDDIVYRSLADLCGACACPSEAVVCIYMHLYILILCAHIYMYTYIVTNRDIFRIYYFIYTYIYKFLCI